MLLQAAYALCPFSVCEAASVNPSHSISHHMRRFAHADLLYQNEFEFLIWTRRRFAGVCVCVYSQNYTLMAEEIIRVKF